MLTAQVASVGRPNLDRANLDRVGEQPRLQTPAPARTSAAGAPIVGYSLGPGAADVHLIVVKAADVQVGGLLTVPVMSKRVYLPPRQQYALVEQTSNDPVAVWAIHKAATSGMPQDLIAISGALAHPDLVSFSPRGEAILLYSKPLATLQVVSHLPAEPVVSRSLSVPSNASSKMTVSDDGAVVSLVLTDGSLIAATEGGSWQPLHTSFLPEALSFVSKTHDLAVSDVSQKLIALLQNVDKGPGMTYQVLAQDLPADQLAMTRGGERLLAANRSRGLVWTIDLHTGAVLHKEEVTPLTDFSSLRDGYSFLLSTATGPTVLKPRAVPSNAEGSR